MQSNDTLSITDSNITLSGLDATQVASRYPGLSRIKPYDYFGVDHRDVSKRLGLSQAEASALFQRTLSACKAYFPGELGRFYSHEPNITKKRRTNFVSITADLNYTPDPPASTLTAEFVYPALKCFRTIISLPVPSGKFRVAPPDQTNAPAMLRISTDCLPKEYGAFYSDRCPPSVWLSMLEARQLGVEKEAIEAGFYDGHIQSPNLREAQYTDWESLSLSIELAHQGKITSLLRDQSNYDSDSQYYAVHIRGLIRLALMQSTSNHQFLYSISANSVKTNVDSAYISEVYKHAYSSGLLPVKPRKAVAMNWVRAKSGFDSLFEMILTANTSILLDADKRACEKLNRYEQ